MFQLPKSFGLCNSKNQIEAVHLSTYRLNGVGDDSVDGRTFLFSRNFLNIGYNDGL